MGLKPYYIYYIYIHIYSFARAFMFFFLSLINHKKVSLSSFRLTGGLTLKTQYLVSFLAYLHNILYNSAEDTRLLPLCVSLNALGGGGQYRLLVSKKGSIMKLIITIDGDHKVTIEETEGNATYDDIVSVSMSLLDSATSQFIKSGKMDREQKEHLYDVLDTLFFRFMERVFPDVQPREFELSDAGLLYAQDMIINLAEKEGLTFEKALKKFEKEARAYVKQKGKVS